VTTAIYATDADKDPVLLTCFLLSLPNILLDNNEVDDALD
jgi:hypothetical protein